MEQDCRTARNYRLFSFKQDWKYRRTLSIVSAIMNSLMYIICLSSAFKTSDISSIPSHIAVILVQLLSLRVHDAISIINSKDILTKSLVSSIVMFIPQPKTLQPWGTVMFSISPCFGLVGSIIGSLIVLTLLESKKAIIWWTLSIIIGYLAIPFFRYKMQKRRVSTIWQWDECLPCRCSRCSNNV